VAALDLLLAPEFPDDDVRYGAGSAPRSSRTATVLVSWRASVVQRAGCLTLTALAVFVAITVVLTGPPVSIAFGMRLPLTVLACGGTWCAARWRRRVTVTTDEVIVRGLLRTRRIPRSAQLCSTALGTSLFIARVQRRWQPAPMMTPWLVLTATAGVVATTTKVLSDHPQLTGPLFTGSAAVCLMALAVCLRADPRD
jgi:hypothetical protein